MHIIVDGFGGDHAPLAVLEGVKKAVTDFGVEITVTGDEQKLRACAAENGISLDHIQIQDAPAVITNDDPPTEILKSLSNSSMAIGMKMLANGEGDAFLSAGSTGALVVGASMIVKRIKGIKRAPLGTIIPNRDGCVLLLDVGANAECRPEFLVQFAHMGAFYMKAVMGIENPRVGLLNIGAEEKKGTELQVETYKLLQASNLNFVGNVEGRDVPLGAADVVVSDGFTGNIMLKTMEGMGSFFNSVLKKMFLRSLKTKIGALVVKKDLAGMKKKFDYSEYGGAPLLGISRPVVKAHGSSNGNAFYNAVRQAKLMVENDMVGMISDYAKQSAVKTEGEAYAGN